MWHRADHPVLWVYHCHITHLFTAILGNFREALQAWCVQNVSSFLPMLHH